MNICALSTKFFCPSTPQEPAFAPLKLILFLLRKHGLKRLGLLSPPSLSFCIWAGRQTAAFNQAG